MDEKNSEIVIVENEFKKCEEDLYKLLQVALIELKFINSGIEQPIVERPTFRIKSIESIYRKISNKPHITSKNFTVEIKDLLGIRVICRNLSSLESVYRQLHTSENIVFFDDMEKILIENSDNGYRGIHLIFSVKDKNLSDPQLKGEIQLRTIAQHYWATFSHDDIYKTEPILSENERERLILLSNNLHEVDREIGSLCFDIKSDPFEMNKKTLNSLFQELEINFDDKDIKKLLDMIGEKKIIRTNLVKNRFGIKDIIYIRDALTSSKNKFNADMSEIDVLTNNLYNVILERDASKIEITFCRLYAYFKGFYWPKRRLFEYIVSLKTENWSNLLRTNLSKNLVILLEASFSENIERHSYYHSNFGNQEEEPFLRSYSDSDLISNRMVKTLSKVGLITVKLDENVKTYPDRNYFSYKKDTYQIKCTLKGKNISREIIEKAFHNSPLLKSILDNLENEDFPQADFPYENPSLWGFPRRTVKIFQQNKQIIERYLHFAMKDWWTDEPGYY